MKEDNIYEEYSLRLKKYFLFLTHNNELAEDLMQETFYQAYKSIDRYDGSCKMITWLYQIGKHCYCDYLKKAKHYNTIGIDELLFEPSAPNNIEDDYIKQEFYTAVLKAIDSLKEPYCDIIKLRVFEELSYKEIGDIYNKNENWARVNFFRAKQKLTERLSENGHTL
ncbi:MAG: sigma-70 family RNA polymerase sigma factor [Clostridia bacterium]|nr:sigma-70 family RNA polymerase sigma factor [Clostridia bacterium]MBQ2152907.1 sigma-70 family RNA polymerase sigma factor [Clostridia bacterium]MBQ5440574.1 sigma-70 family RNA polymerase sigma factor [Clostridia bacterium]